MRPLYQLETMGQVAKLLIVTGALLLLVGGLLLLGSKLGLGRLPGDLVFEGKRTSFHFPIVTSLLLSVVLTVLLNLWFRSR